MKKAYSKPRIYVESFAVSQTIADNCGKFTESGTGRPNFGDKFECGWDMGGFAIWAEATSKCTFKEDTEGEVNGYCYNNPQGFNQIFGS